MASIRTIAQDVLADARDGIGWIAVWKDSKGWMAMVFYPEYDEDTNTATMEGYEVERLRNLIENIDPNAIIVNSYYHNLGDTSVPCMTRDDLAAGLRWQYENGYNLVADFLKNIQIVQMGS